MNQDSNLSEEIVKEKIRRAFLSAPDIVARDATVAELEAQGKMNVLRPGTKHRVCVPGNENIIGKSQRVCQCNVNVNVQQLFEDRL